MSFRREQPGEKEEQEDGLNIISDDDDDDADDEEDAGGDLFELGQLCDVCQSAEGRIGLDPTCRGAYDGDPVLVCGGCAPDALRKMYESVEGAAVIVEPFGAYAAHYYYRIDEMPAYRFVRDDIEGVSWLLLTVGDNCGRCGEQSRFAWLTRDFVDQALPEDRAVFRNLDRDIEHLCGGCASQALCEHYLALDAPLITAELPRSAMGVLMPTGE